MTVATKTAYTAEQTVSLLAAFAAKTSIEDLATQFGKSTKSIVAKLSREGVYEAKAKTKATTGAPVTKATLVADLEACFELKAGTLASLEKGTKEALQALVGAV